MFRDDPVVNPQDVHLHVKEGIATLEGRVQSRQEKQTALDLAKMVKGVREVRDELAVQFVSGRPDSALREEIVRRLAFDVWIGRPSLLKVDVRDGRVILNGQVGSAYERHRVAELAWIEGVRKVDATGVTVEWESLDPMVRSHRPTPPDQDIAEAIRTVLASDRRVSQFPIQVTVKNGMVSLKGQVPFLSIKREVEQDVNNTLGVQSVQNLIEVEADTSLNDADIRKRINGALSRDPVLTRFGLDVSVRKGTALLTGTVESIYERNLAENVSSRVRGVHSIQNQIVFSTPEIHKTDWEIQLDIDNQVWWSPFLSGQDIVATVQDGKATLTGSVDHVHQRLIAEQQAFEAGASAVHNQLRVGKASVRPGNKENKVKRKDLPT
jgi:osmotically-inducible protein OsmY